MSPDPRTRDLAHVGPVELFTPTFEESRAFLRGPDGDGRGGPARRFGVSPLLG